VESSKKTLQLRAEIEAGGNGAAPAAEKHYDLSYYRMALAKVKYRVGCCGAGVPPAFFLLHT